MSFSEENQYRADVDRTGEPIRLGVSNDEGPTCSNPGMRAGLLTAIDVMNANGRINGATLEPVVCVGHGRQESAVNCATSRRGGRRPRDLRRLSIDTALAIYEGAGLAVISGFAYNQTPSDKYGR